MGWNSTLEELDGVAVVANSLDDFASVLARCSWALRHHRTSI